MSDPNSSLYIPLRRSLELLSEEFRFLSQKYPPIRYQCFVSSDLLTSKDKREQLADCDTPEEQDAMVDCIVETRCHPTRKNWDAFVASNQDKFGGDWSHWDGPKDGRFFGRFFGSPLGWEEFRALAESAYLTLCEIRGTDPSDGYNGWIGAICDQAQYSPSPLLRRTGCPPKLFFFDDEADGMSCDSSWWVDEDGDPIPTEPVYFELAHDVFVSSIAAIRYLLEPESVLLIGEQIGYSPTDRPIFEAVEETAGSKENADSQSELGETPFRRFEFDGATWHIEFIQNGESESGVFTTNRKGMKYWERLVRQPGIWIKAVELQEPLKGNYEGASEGENDMEGYQMEQTTQDQVDDNYINDCKKTIARLCQEIDKSEDLEQRKRLEMEKNNIVKYLRRSRNYRGRPRHLGPGMPEEKARNAVGNAARKVVQNVIARSMPKCGQHLIKCLSGRGNKFAYLPWRQKYS